MRLRNIQGSKEVILKSPFVVQNPKEEKGNWKAVFPKEQPLYIEVGMGKGRFLMDMARLHPEINYIGIEMYDSVLLRAIQRREQQAEPLDNLLFLRMDARELPEVFASGEVGKIYLNFSDPWPKERHAKRRLTSGEFLGRYARILKPEGRVEFKTDNRALFEFSLEEIKEAGWETEAVTWDLHRDVVLMQENVMTEYEEKFSMDGNPIHKVVTYIKEKR